MERGAAVWVRDLRGDQAWLPGIVSKKISASHGEQKQKIASSDKVDLACFEIEVDILSDSSSSDAVIVDTVSFTQIYDGETGKYDLTLFMMYFFGLCFMYYLFFFCLVLTFIACLNILCFTKKLQV